jgi:hypothetical protein
LISRNRIELVGNFGLRCCLHLWDLVIVRHRGLSDLLHGVSASQPLEFVIEPRVRPVELLYWVRIIGLLRLPHLWLVIVQFISGDRSGLELIHAVPVSLLDLEIKVLGSHIESGLVVEVGIDGLLADISQFGNDVL